MSFISSMIMSAAGKVFSAGREAYQSAKEESQRAQDQLDSASTSALSQTRAKSALDRQRMAMGGGQSFAQHFQSQIAKATDTDGDGKISASELSSKVLGGGGTQAQADQLYRALDANRDGTVTTDELKDATPVPNTNVAQQIMQLLQAHREAVANGSSNPKADAAAAVKQATNIDASLALSKLAGSMPVLKQAS